uniref:SH3 domain-containing protein n=1 Tax=Chromera velia CCMP2878 TaxID=1169474 RepID=A0A0G4G8T5_9ALVE|eukprot:Cvel_4376.t1-p1 / transcript=Cvel_4376.t1 / gene=Cvel_4376 / organism=Chromera_velia_CCMP2878 / gene_product=hypothetical protein / transcript_product=hypothetical protein / location=Cvel_scaffold189:113224-114648(-) / protein_length=475 / sequence_SO=supercontig / SO=protein_coding / is_pseudo=false
MSDHTSDYGSSTYGSVGGSCLSSESKALNRKARRAAKRESRLRVVAEQCIDPYELEAVKTGLGDLSEFKCVRTIATEPDETGKFPCLWTFVEIPAGFTHALVADPDNAVHSLVCKEHVRLQIDAMRSKLDILQSKYERALTEISSLRASGRGAHQQQAPGWEWEAAHATDHLGQGPSPSCLGESRPIPPVSDDGSPPGFSRRNIEGPGPRQPGYPGGLTSLPSDGSVYSHPASTRSCPLNDGFRGGAPPRVPGAPGAAPLEADAIGKIPQPPPQPQPGAEGGTPAYPIAHAPYPSTVWGEAPAPAPAPQTNHTAPLQPHQQSYNANPQQQQAPQQRPQQQPNDAARHAAHPQPANLHTQTSPIHQAKQQPQQRQPQAQTQQKQPPPPPPPPRPPEQRLGFHLVQHRHTPHEGKEVPLLEGDVVEITHNEKSGWSWGRVVRPSPSWGDSWDSSKAFGWLPYSKLAPIDPSGNVING